MTTTRKHLFFGERFPFFKGIQIAGWVIFGIIAAAVFALVFGFFVMLLWNWLMPLIFNLPEITYWQAFGIVILVKLIFGTLGHGRNNRKDRFHPYGKWKEWDSHSAEWDMDDYMNRRKYYGDFWRDRGKTAFENYVKEREAENGES